MHLSARFDDRISVVLQPALAAYELDRAQGASSASGNADFQCSVKRLVHKGEVFKAYPTCFAHCHAPTIAACLRRIAAVRDIVSAVGVNTPGGAGPRGVARHGVRVKVTAYPEGLCAVWVMLAVCYNDA